MIFLSTLITTIQSYLLKMTKSKLIKRSVVEPWHRPTKWTSYHEREILDRVPDLEEVEKAIKTFKSGKSPGWSYNRGA